MPFRTSSPLPLLLLLAVTFAVLNPAASSAGALAPARASDLVVVYTKVGAPCTVAGRAFDTRVLADGTEEPFVIPPKQVFVITSFDFVLGGGGANATAAPVLSLQTAGSAPLLQGAATTDAAGNASGTVTAPSGVAAKPGGTLCIIGGATPSGIVRGFFAKDK